MKYAEGAAGKSREKSKSIHPAAQEPKRFTEEERAAMRERLEELAADTGRGKGSRQDQENAVVEKIRALPQPDRDLAERLHALIKVHAPALSPKTWYGMPAYAKDGNIVCFFQSAQKFKTRYATLGFTDKAKLDDGSMWPTAFALRELTPAEETRIIELLKKAVS
jgi:uncharacterized protein YdhG (YjbR/CyaY superfamily)